LLVLKLFQNFFLSCKISFQ